MLCLCLAKQFLFTTLSGLSPALLSYSLITVAELIIKENKKIILPLLTLCEDVIISAPFFTRSSHPPDDMEDGGYEELVVDGHRHVTRLVEGRRYGADCVAEVDAPQQEQELRWDMKKKGNNKFTWRV